ncbi:DMT family transporter [Candidatus Micrarchaeota archaeon]|nr:DMT family transporter [Candidatus Micrarchaeota archaeon]
MSESKGIVFALITAFISGVSIFLNQFAVGGFDASLFTFLKNGLVAVFLLSVLFLLREWRDLQAISGRQWISLVGIGFIGGFLPFLLFFNALQQTTAVNAGFIHKTLFIWASFLAVIFLKEKLDVRFAAGAALLLLGNFFFFSDLAAFSMADAMILLATVLWASDNVWAKHVLSRLNGRIVAFGRMFFGSLFLLGYLALTGKWAGVGALSVMQWQWVFLTTAFLTLFVLFWYTGLKYIRVSMATAILMLGQPITAMLSFAFLGQTVSLEKGIGLLLMVTGAITVVGISALFNSLKNPGLILAGKRS